MPADPRPNSEINEERLSTIEAGLPSVPLLPCKPQFEAVYNGPFFWSAYWWNCTLTSGLPLRMYAGHSWTRRRALKLAEATWRFHVEREAEVVARQEERTDG